VSPAAEPKRGGRRPAAEGEESVSISLKCGHREAELFRQLAEAQGMQRAAWMIEVVRLAAAAPDEVHAQLRLIAAAREFMAEVGK